MTLRTPHALRPGPVGRVHLAALVLSFGRGAWFTCSAMFFLHSAGLTVTEYGVGLTVAGALGMAAGGPLGYLADRVGAREVLAVVTTVQGLSVAGYILTRQFWAVMALTCVMIACDRAAPGIRIALIAGLTTPEERIADISTNRVMTQGGIVVGAVLGAYVLALDSRAGYTGLLAGYAATNVAFAVLLLRVPHVESMADRGVRRRSTVLRDRPFLALTGFNGLLALCWGMLTVGVPLWLTKDTHAPLWMMGVLIGFNAVMIVLFQNAASRRGATVRTAGRLGLWAGVTLAVACALFAATYHGSGFPVVALLALAATAHVAGELLFMASGFGISVGLTPPNAHGEYQGTFATGQAAAQMVAPSVMALVVVHTATVGWFILAGVFLLAGIGTLRTAEYALRRGKAAEAAAEGSEGSGDTGDAEDTPQRYAQPDRA
ncbi:MFS transporter [Catenulispora subtropica]|uniref:MFS transporter n=1 Tax=Catenulispora subtropica TaxID=450798 RepID=A0ABN2T342_9ACTN